MLRRAGVVIVLVACTLAGAPAVHAKERLVQAECSWPMYGREVGRSFAQARRCTDIRTANVGTLTPAWFVPTADSVTASAAVVGNTAFIGSWDGIMRALDLRTGRERWRFVIDDTSNVAFGRIASSAAVVEMGRTRIVLFGGGATLYALDARNGNKLAAVCVDPRAEVAKRCRGDSDGDIEIESSPAVVKRTPNEADVIIGMDVHNAEGVGRTGVISFRLKKFGKWSLQPRWKFDPESAQTYTGENLLTHGSGTGKGCGGVWASPAVDADNGLVFFGTSSCSHDGIASGESLYAVGLEKGGLVWTYDAHAPGRYPSRRWDDDFGASPNLLPFGLVGNGGKDGRYYALNRRTGEPRWITQAGQAGHLTVDFAVGGMIGTSAVGAVNGEPAIFATTAISTPLRAPMDEAPMDVDPTLTEDPGRLMSIHAIRVRDGKVLWRSPFVRASYGAPTVANGVVLVPSTFDLSVKALHADTGMLLWASPLLGAPSSAPVPVGATVVIGTGTRTTDAEYKAFGAGALDALLGPSPLAPLSGVWAFRLANH